MEPKENPIEVEVFIKKQSDKHCNGKRHRLNEYCQRPAGWGTSHPGTGRCKLHGGCNVNKKSGELRYSDYIPTAIIGKYEEFAVEPDIDMKSLNDEIALIRAKIAYVLSHPDHCDDDLLLKLTEIVRRLVLTKQKVEEIIESKINLEAILKIVDNVIEIIDKRVQDIETKKLIATDMRQLNLRELGLD